MIVASDAKGDYAFLSLKSPAFDLSDRGVSGRAVAAGLDAFVYTERGVYRSGETVQVTALLRDPQARGGARRAADPGGRAARRRRVPAQHRGRSGRRRPCAAGAAGGLGPERHLAGARLHGSQASAGRRDQLHGRGLCAGSARVHGRLDRQERVEDQSGRDHGRRPLPLRRAHLRARARRRGGDRAGDRARRVCRLCVRACPTRRSRPRASRSRTCPTPMPTARRISRSRPTSCRARPARSRPRSWCAWRRPAAARSSASSRCR